MPETSEMPQDQVEAEREQDVVSPPEEVTEGVESEVNTDNVTETRPNKPEFSTRADEVLAAGAAEDAKQEEFGKYTREVARQKQADESTISKLRNIIFGKKKDL